MSAKNKIEQLTESNRQLRERQERLLQEGEGYRKALAAAKEVCNYIEMIETASFTMKLVAKHALALITASEKSQNEN
jgi:hypothetical protein